MIAVIGVIWGGRKICFVLMCGFFIKDRDKRKQ